MRFIAAALLLTIAGCSPPSSAPTTISAQAAAPTQAASAAGPAADARAVLGQWSFDRSCGVYDLVFNPNDEVLYFDYSNPSQVVSYAGRYSTAGNRIVLTVNESGEEGSELGPTVIYNIDLSAPVTDDLAGAFGAAGKETRLINAKRCLEEDRE